MIIINEKEYLNLQEQVWRNAETIRCLLSGLKITGTGPTLPPDPENQDAFLLQQDGKTYLRIYFEADQAWANLGEFPAVGPQGIPGPQGSAATIGAVECSTRTISAGDSASVEVSVSGTNLRFDFEIPQGAVGAQGPRGERGPQGLTGETGPRGPQGETGSSISIAGTLTSSANLPDPETVSATTAYLVGLTAPYNLYVIVGAAGSRLWKDVGAVTPQNITVDASMSGTSQNPVQNRVVKSYVDAVKTTAEAAYTRSTSNLGRINAIQNVDLPDIYYELADLKEVVFETVAAVAAYVVDPAAFFVTPSYITIDNVAYPVIDDTDAEVAEILGSTVVWNQLVSGTPSVSFTGTTIDTTVVSGLNIPSGHAVLLIWDQSVALTSNTRNTPYYIEGGSSVYMTSGSNANLEKGIHAWLRVSSGAITRLNYWLNGADADVVESGFKIIDLTVAIPTNTPTEVSDDRVQQIIQYALANPAYAENALLDFKIDNITSRGFNQWDEVLESGSIGSSGQDVADASRTRTGYIRVKPGENYYFKTGASNSIEALFLYDVNKTFISSLTSYQDYNNAIVPMPSNCLYIRFRRYGTTYNNDICVNVSNPSLNGQYKTSRESSIDWESIIPDDEDRTARSAGTVRDVIYVRDDGNDTFSIVKRKTTDEVDMETLNWTYGSFGGVSGWYTDDLALSKTGSYDVVPNFICDKYEVVGARSIRFVEGTITNQDSLARIWVNNNSNTIEPTGTLCYELATPQETVLASGLLYDHVSFLIERGGTIAINGGMPDALPGVEIDIPVKRFNE